MGVWTAIDGDRLELGHAQPFGPQTPGAWRRTRDSDGVEWLLLDLPDASTNRLDMAMLDAFDQILADLERNPPKGLVIRSAKRTGFVVGADIAQFRGQSDPAPFAAALTRMHGVMDRLEALPIPTVAVIHGYCLGGGLELALACRYRIATPDASMGFPEVQLGLHPGLGGAARSTRLLDPIDAMTLMLTGKNKTARQALRSGLVDGVAEERHMAAAVRAAIAGKLKPRPKKLLSRLLSNGLVRPHVAALLGWQTRKQARPEHYPAPFALIDLWRRHGGDFRAMKAGEVPSFCKLLVSPTSQNLVRLFFLREGMKGWTKGGRKIERVHVVGAGAMGGDIAAWCALSGLKVSLADMSPKALAGAIKRAADLHVRRHMARRLSRDAFDRLIPDSKGEGASTADMIIEAIPEKLDLKRKVYAGLEAKMKADALLATNTSSLKLEDLRVGLAHPERLVGVHFFNPVARMQLVEIVRHDAADPQTLATAGAFAARVSRLPALVGSAPGFLVNRALTPYLLEALAIVDEGVAMETVDAAAVRFGMPMGPIELADQVGLDICLDVAEILRAGISQPLPAIPDWLHKKIENGELGKKTGKGLYVYRQGKPQKRAPAKALDPDLTDRLILPMVNTCVACLREGVADSEEVIDGAMVFGTGFAPFRGGPLRYARERGVDDVTAALARLAAKHGPRFEPDAGWPTLKA